MEQSLNVGILGVGWFGREAHLANLVRMEDVRVVAFSSRSERNRTKAKQIAPDAQAAAEWREVIESPAVEAVVISLPNYLHCAASVAALEAGKHVLCEKPLGLTVDECDRVIAAARSAGKVLQVGHEMRHQRLYRHLKQMVSRGDVGQPRLMWCREFRGPMRTGWRSTQSQTGGAILEKNCHHFDLFNWVLDARPLAVAAFGGRNVLTDRELLDNALIIVEYEGGRRAVVELCLFAPYGSDVEIGVVGDLGRIDTFNQAMKLVYHRFDVPERMELQAADAPQEAGFVDAAGHVNRGVYAELREFVDCCRRGVQPLVDGRAGRLSVAVSLAAQESIKRGQTVTMEELLGERA